MKELFPIYNNNKNLVYLDSAASSLKPQKVIDAINDYYINYSCNIERGVYSLSLDATEKCNESRRTIAKYINANENEVVFTRGTSSSLNMVARMIGKTLNDGDEIITSQLEHHSSFLPWLELKKEKNIKIVFVELSNDNKITVENFKKALTDKTKVVALTHVSNVLGYKTPIKEIIDLAHSKGAIVSVDGAQAAPHLALDMKKLNADFYSFGLHKMFGPTGIGILYGKKELLDKYDPVEFGGEMIGEVSIDDFTYKDAPYKFETGTMPIAEIFGAKAAIDFINSVGIENIEKKSIDLRNIALNELKKIKEVEIYNDKEESSIITFNIKGVHSHDSVSFLSNDNLCIRAGHHCAEPLHIYLDLNSTLRASFYLYNDIDDVNYFVSKVKEAVKFFKEVGYIA